MPGSSTLITDYLGSGLDANKPASPSIPAGGIALYYATDTAKIYYWNTSAWVAFSSGGGGGGSSTPSFGGRLTLLTGTPFLTADVTGATTIFYTPAVGNTVLLWNGTAFTATTFPEISQALSDTTKSPAATVANSNYDLFVWSDGGTVRLSRGPAWSSNTARGTGAGTTQLNFVNGIYVNASAITNGPAAGFGTYVGTIRTDNSNAVDMMFAPVGANGGTANKLFLWNMYNRRAVSSVNYDTTASWTYSAAAWEVKNGSANNQTAFVCGIAEDAFSTLNSTVFSGNGSNINGECGVGLDGTTLPATGSQASLGVSITSGIDVVIQATLDAMPSIGYHFVAPLEHASGTGVLSWKGWRFTAADVPLPFTFKWLM